MEHQLSKWWWRSIALLLSTSPPAALVLFQDSLAPRLALLTSEATLKLIAGILLSTLALLAYLLLQRPWLRWDAVTSTWVSRFTHIRYCSYCKTNKKISPLGTEDHGWRCHSCNSFYDDPKDRPPSPPRKSHVNPYAA